MSSQVVLIHRDLTCLKQVKTPDVSFQNLLDLFHFTISDNSYWFSIPVGYLEVEYTCKPLNKIKIFEDYINSYIVEKNKNEIPVLDFLKEDFISF